MGYLLPVNDDIIVLSILRLEFSDVRSDTGTIRQQYGNVWHIIPRAVGGAKTLTGNVSDGVTRVGGATSITYAGECIHHALGVAILVQKELVMNDVVERYGTHLYIILANLQFVSYTLCKL